MADLHFCAEDDPMEADIAMLGDGLNDHAVPHTGVAGFKQLAVFVRDDDGVTQGGVWGYVNWNWLNIGLI